MKPLTPLERKIELAINIVLAIIAIVGIIYTWVQKNLKYNDNLVTNEAPKKRHYYKNKL